MKAMKDGKAIYHSPQAKATVDRVTQKFINEQQVRSDCVYIAPFETIQVDGIYTNF